VILSRLPAALRGVLTSLLLGLSTVLLTASLVPFSLLKLLVPVTSVRRVADRALNALASAWVAINNAWIAAVRPNARWDVQGLDGLHTRGWYLVSSNHQSWVDILVLQRVFHGRIPFLKFFLKQELIWVPVIGWAWWALDFPFMKRYSKAQLRRNPALGRKDQETARRACEKFKLVPTSVMVFAEGTRFSEARRQAQSSPYRNLLKPRAGALATTLNAMGTQFRSMIDATIIYPDGVPSFWHLASGRAGRIVVRIRQIPIPDDFCGGDYAGDKAFRSAFHHWLADQWQAKDREIDAVMEAQRPLNADRD